jgi:ribosome maturation factor RimP
MSKTSETSMEGRVSAIAARVADSTGLELILTEFGRAGRRLLVRMTIDRAGGVTIDDCAEFSRRVGAVLEAEDPIPSAYSLEVSSPGLDRRLVSAADFERFTGRRAKISLREPLAGRRNFQGVLRGVEANRVQVEIEGGEMAHLPLESVDVARLVPEF